MRGVVRGRSPITIGRPPPGLFEVPIERFSLARPVGRGPGRRLLDGR
jgi:hypothetical protein